jgi:phage-related protein
MIDTIDYFVYGGEGSREHGLFIRDFPTYYAAERRISAQEIPARNGTVIDDEGSFSNVTSIYNVWMKHDFGIEKLHSLSYWLLGGKGYRKLEDSFEPEVYRMAVCSNALEVAMEIERKGSAEITFNCKPQRFLRFGDLPVRAANGGSLYNRYMPSRPQIILQGTGSGAITIGGKGVVISNIPSTGLCWTVTCRTHIPARITTTAILIFQSLMTIRHWSMDSIR